MAKKRSRKRSGTKSSERLTLRAYAERRGVSPEAVSKAIRRGALTTSVEKTASGRWSIDPVAADEEWGRRTNAAKSRGRDVPRPEIVPEEDLEELDLDQLERLISKYRGDLPAQQAFKFEVDARAKLLALKERQGQLVDAEEVRRHGFELSRTCRDQILGIPARLAPELAAETDPFKIHQALERELAEALNALADGFKKIRLRRSA